MYPYEVMTEVATQKFVAIVRAADRESGRAQVRALVDAGVRVLEVSLVTPGALELVAEVRASHPDVVAGVGTVLDAASALAAVQAGAQLLVAPTVDAGVLETGHRYGAAVLPGVATPTEAVRAASLGADGVKWFPAAATIGLEGLRAVRTALPQLALVPTGGIGPHDAAGWLAAGAVAVGMGGALTSDPARTAERVAALRAALGDGGAW